MTAPKKPMPIRLPCPMCCRLHVDVGKFATKVHHTHACQHCGHVWRPAIEPTVGVQFLPGYKDEPPAPPLEPGTYWEGECLCGKHVFISTNETGKISCSHDNPACSAMTDMDTAAYIAYVRHPRPVTT